jgi:hypothetical protein
VWKVKIEIMRFLQTKTTNSECVSHISISVDELWAGGMDWGCSLVLKHLSGFDPQHHIRRKFKK